MLNSRVNREELENGLAREEYEKKASQITAGINRVEAKSSELQTRIKQEVVAKEQPTEAMDLIRKIH